MGGRSDGFISFRRIDSSVPSTVRPHPLKHGRILECWNRTRAGSTHISCSSALLEFLFALLLLLVFFFDDDCPSFFPIMVVGFFSLLDEQQPTTTGKPISASGRLAELLLTPSSSHRPSAVVDAQWKKEWCAVHGARRLRYNFCGRDATSIRRPPGLLSF